MPGIRTLREDDLERVAVVYEQAARSGRMPPPGLAAAMGRIFLDAPHGDGDCPSLVHEDANGRVDAFMGVLVRRMRLGEEALRIGVAGPMVVAPDTTSKAVGVLLDRHLMTSGYDAVLTDGASRDALNVWTRLGGIATPLGSMHWTCVFRPATHAVDDLVERPRVTAARLTGPVRALRPVARLTDRLARRRGRASAAERRVEALPLGADELLEGLAALAPRIRLRPDYDRDTLEWLFRELRAIESRGQLRGHLLRGAQGRILGWYLYYLLRDGPSHVLQVAAAPGAMPTVVDHLLADAETGGAVALEGRAELALFEPLEAHRVRYRYAAPFSLLQTKRSDVLAALYSGNALLTRLEGEWWMALHREAYGGPPISDTARS
jgi:hypothetical protein